MISKEQLKNDLVRDLITLTGVLIPCFLMFKIIRQEFDYKIYYLLMVQLFSIFSLVSIFKFKNYKIPRVLLFLYFTVITPLAVIGTQGYMATFFSVIPTILIASLFIWNFKFVRNLSIYYLTAIPFLFWVNSIPGFDFFNQSVESMASQRTGLLFSLCFCSIIIFTVAKLTRSWKLETEKQVKEDTERKIKGSVKHEFNNALAISLATTNRLDKKYDREEFKILKERLLEITEVVNK